MNKPKYYENKHHRQSLDDLICNILVMESFYNNKGKGLSRKEVLKKLKSRDVNISAQDLDKTISSSLELIEYNSNIVKKTWTTFQGHYLSV